METLSQRAAAQYRALRRKKVRRAEGRCLAEGVRVCREVLASPHTLEAVFLTADAAREAQDLAARAAATGARSYRVTARVLASLSDVVSPSGLMFCVRPTLPPSADDAWGSPVIALDHVADPANLGTIVRTAVWFGVGAVLIGRESAEPFSPKVIRASAGTIFDARVYPDVALAETLPRLRAGGWSLLGADRDGLTPLERAPRADRRAIVFGHETAGLTEAVRDLCDVRVRIPGAGTADSLNVAIAAGIMLWELVGARRPSMT